MSPVRIKKQLQGLICTLSARGALLSTAVAVAAAPVLVVGFLLVASAAHAQPAVPDGPPFLVNTVTDGTQDVPSVSKVGLGGFVIVWESDAEFNDRIVGQRFDEDSNRVGNQFPVSLSDRSQRLPAVAPTADGFVAVWQDSDDDNILGRRFDDQGPTGTQGLVNSNYTNLQQEFPAIASDAEGNFVVVYESLKFPADGDGDAIVARLFSAVATPLSLEFLVNTVRSGDQEHPAVGRQPGGNFLVAWESDDFNNTGIFAQIFDADGVKLGDQFLVNGIQENNQEYAAVGAWSGGYVVAWESFPDGEGRGIFARRFDSVGIPLGDQFLVNTVQDRDQRFASVSVFDGGEFVIVWEDDDLGAVGQEFDAAGIKIGDQFLVSPSDAFQREPRVAVQEGGFLITWFGGGAEIDDDILGRHYVVPEPDGATMLGAGFLTLVVLARTRRSRS
jgi:hypothetical protein